MPEFFGKLSEPFLILHGGAGPADPGAERLLKSTNNLIEIARSAIESLSGTSSAVDIVTTCLKSMEDCETFNAGRGSALQGDGQARLTAAIMDGERQSFSGIISATHMIHPSILAKHLQKKRSRVLTSPGVELLARKVGLEFASPITHERLEAWIEKNHGDLNACDTVGCVVSLKDSSLASGTSTGGRGNEFPGRVSDSGTVAGNYASQHAAISCTGIGEEIVDDAVAARLETRRRDGLSLKEASTLCYKEARAKGRKYGWIALDSAGNWALAHTTPAMTYVVISASSEIIASSTP